MGKAGKYIYQDLGTGKGFLNSTPVSPANDGQMGSRVYTMKETTLPGDSLQSESQLCVLERTNIYTKNTGGVESINQKVA